MNWIGWRVVWMVCWLIGGVVCGGRAEAGGVVGVERYNILFAIADDQSYQHTGANGDAAVKTPGFDRVSREGVRFTHAFVAAPSCTPSRTGVLSGQAIWRTGRGGMLYGTLEPDMKVYPRLLEAGGYFIGATGKTWSPGLWDAGGRKTHPMGKVYGARKDKTVPKGVSIVDYAANFKDFLDERPADQPFCFWYGGSEPHRDYAEGLGLASGKRTADAKLFASLPNDPIVRNDVLDYYMEIEHFDRHLVRMLEMLEARGELDRTLVIVTSDHGMPFPRCKSTLYDSGTRVPLAIRLPGVIAPGRTVDDFVSLTDVAPTILEFSGRQIPSEMTGRSLAPILKSNKSGAVEARRDFVVTAFERHTWCRPNGVGYPMRAIRTADYLYIRNYEPDRWPVGDPELRPIQHARPVPWPHAGYGDIDSGPTRRLYLEDPSDPVVARYFNLAAAKRPEHELYAIATDPDQIHNLSGDPNYKKIVDNLAARLQAYLLETGDPRAKGLSPWDGYPYYRAGKIWYQEK